MKIDALTNVQFHWPWEYTGPWPWVFETRDEMIEKYKLGGHFCIAWTFATPFFQILGFVRSLMEERSREPGEE